MTANETVFVVDDDPRMRDSLRWLLSAANLAVETYASAEEFLNVADASRGGCLVLDVSMPGMSGLLLQQELATREVSIPIIFITAYGDVGLAVRAGRAGAADFISKPYDDRVLLQRIREVLDAGREKSSEDMEGAGFSAGLEALTPREREVLTLIVAGRTSKEIARELGVSHRTIDVHRARLKRKLGVDSVAALVRLFLTTRGGVTRTA
jgi:RNA polymerase sigma factor (sigma-70 family)